MVMYLIKKNLRQVDLNGGSNHEMISKYQVRLFDHVKGVTEYV